MPNRVMREGALHSRAVNAVSRDAELLWRRILHIADDWGLFEADPYSIKVRAFGGRPDVTPEQCDAWLEECAQVELVLLYEDAGRCLGAVNKWQQRRFATRPRYPLPPWGESHILGGYVDPRARPGYEAPPEKPKRKRGAAHTAKGNGIDSASIPDWLPAELYLSWWQAKPKRARTAKAHELALRKLEELRAAGSAPAEVLEHCIRSGYQGIFPPPAARAGDGASEQHTAAAPASKPVTCAGCGKPVFGADACQCNPQTRRLQVAA